MSTVRIDVTHDMDALFVSLFHLAQSPTDFLDEIGNAIVQNIKMGFTRGESPSGEKWEKLNYERKAGNGKGARGFGGDKVLIDNGHLAESIAYHANGFDLTIGSALPYAATHQYGDDKRNIPARPFLPEDDNLPDDWEQDVWDSIDAHLGGILL